MIDPDVLINLFTKTRSRTEEICSFLKTEDYVVQPIEDVSPPKWHLGHTTWFFEEFVLKENVRGYQVFDDRYAYVFNSYYESAGDKVVRSDRGNLSRPTVSEVYEFRKYVTEQLLEFLTKEQPSAQLRKVVELGCHHEKQHQELLLTDIKFILGNNPLHPVYHKGFEENQTQDFPQEWISMEEGIYKIGHHHRDTFCYDNELGYHKTFLHEYQISNKLITNKEYLEFMIDGGYDQVLLWHAEGWDWVKQNGIKSPFYWFEVNGSWQQYTLAGLEPLDLQAPVTHLSYYEAFAYAQWLGMRLPTEFEWEAAQKRFDWGCRWEWTESAYSPYPHYTKAPGALGEYNGKFMVNQKVLRGSSVATAPNHVRPTYRNFFHPHLRWQFTGLRLAK
jgi:ergothioneine biosynthesis protein EgtB